MFHMGWFLSYAVQAWRAPFSGRAETDWKDPGLYVDAARALERAGFDYMMFEDGSFIPDAFGGSAKWSLANAMTAPKHDPLALVATVGAATSRIGLIATITTTFYPPFLAARLLTTLDHLTEGRCGLNLVTSHNVRTAQNYGLDEQIEHDRRYAIADEWMDAVSALWDCWDDDALVMDHETGVFADHTKVRHADFAGEYFRTRGPLNVPPGPQRRPVVCQAGGSPAGREFGARHADTIIAQAYSVADMKAYRADIDARAAAAGRDPKDVKVLFLATFTFGDSEERAREKARAKEAAAAAAIEPKLASLSFASGIDFGAFPLDEPLPEIRTNAAQSVTALHLRGTEGMTLREIAARRMTGAVEFTGTPDGVAAQMGEAMAEAGGDGFLVQAPITRRIVAEVADGLAPALRRRGLVRDGYAHPTFRENLLAF
ncbi:NtaA/DmoA family FMN-dependent monooxygenase [Pseudonocardia sp. WMMC193]|uniref:NtaA/DmoA family FMN-dependent monooxygenase n=1 Tax=Pseudonocardia sp. WMMC193 TaxID=2911965 RepID=UPI001EEE7B05|nr:NtaA/DmoA family FMN-dependent monooxygenase [Pseudonocardia sp. WMMC193]MCF7550462.1 NtaA/DmoA family FMN-dependent monooxygenase [Pseudonocardia sp. WMMC193]